MATHNGFPDSGTTSTLGTMAASAGDNLATERLRNTLRTNGATDNVTEATGLLSTDDDLDGAPRKDSWAAMKDFDGLPWWRKPAVCSEFLMILVLMSH